MTHFRFRLLTSLFVLCAAARLDGAVHVALLQTDAQQTGTVVAAVETELAAGTKVSLVERQQIEKILHEQRLQTVLGADAVAGRVALGKMLQADLLVFLQYEQQPVPHLNVVISETHQGLRIVRQSVSLQNQESAVAALTRIIKLAVDKQSQEISAIFAIPPFVSDDLGFTFDHLKGAYATLIEDMVYQQKGALVVELAEARTIAKEIALTDGADVRRPLPLYILGRYRNDGAHDARRVGIDLKLMRGDQELASVTRKEIVPDQVAAVLREVTTTFVSKSNGQSAPPADPRIEAGQLAERARLMKTLGSWRESLDLMEASFLLEPNQPELHLDAVEVLCKFTRENNVFAAEVPLAKRPEGSLRIDYYRRGLEHLEAYLRGTKLDHNRRHDTDVLQQFSSSLDMWGMDMLRDKFMWGRLDPLWLDFVAARHAATDLFYRVLATKARGKVVDDALWYLGLFDEWGIRMLFPPPRGPTWFDGINRAQQRDKRLTLLADFAYLPNEADYLEQLIDFPGIVEANPQELPLQPGYREFLLRAREVPNDALRKKADELLGAIEPLRQRRDAEKKKLAIATPVHKEPSTQAGPSDEVSLTRLTLEVEGPHTDAELLPIAGFLPAGKGIDLVWNQPGIYLMKKPGILRQINVEQLSGYPFRFGWSGIRPHFDGRFVWCAANKLLVIDPQQAHVEEIGPEQGLPACTKMEVTPFAPGKAIVVGYFGQTFVATVELNLLGAAKVKILHEFRKVPKVHDGEQWHDTNFVFLPGPLFALSERTPDGGSKHAALVWRMSEEQSLVAHPLVVDVENGAVRALEEKFIFYYPERMVADGGVCYQFDNLMDGKNVVHCISISKVTERAAGATFRNIFQVFEHDGLLNVIDDDGWNISAKDHGPMRRLKINVPPLGGFHVDPSENYGLIARVNQRKDEVRDEDYNVYGVKFAKPLHELLPESPPK